MNHEQVALEVVTLILTLSMCAAILLMLAKIAGLVIAHATVPPRYRTGDQGIGWVRVAQYLGAAGAAIWAAAFLEALASADAREHLTFLVSAMLSLALVACAPEANRIRLAWSQVRKDRRAEQLRRDEERAARDAQRAEREIGYMTRL